jgi:hypothetical protein
MGKKKQGKGVPKGEGKGKLRRTETDVSEAGTAVAAE